MGLPVTHLDEHYWRPGWVEPTSDKWREQQRALVAAEEWILDGNYGGTFDERLPHADTLFIFGIPRLRCIQSVLIRTAKNHGKPAQAAGCPERFDAEFIKYLWHYPRDSRPRLDQAVEELGQHLRVIEFASRKEAQSFLGQAVAEEE